MQRSENFFAHLGMKNTQGRNHLLDVLEKTEIPLTAEDIYLKLKEKSIEINLSTVYRILDLFVAKGIVSKSTSSISNKSQFELAKKEHSHHLVCIQCKKTLTLAGCPLKCYEKKLKNKTQYDITGHKLEIFGYCPDCKFFANKQEE
ncbi:MAG: transcriptional repressor [Candidatus Brocadiae bacterium]|nr:transcriptional repressor [Candidatus Brocadiia bacterium]